ncbi:MAG: redoxin domain-containing protein [Candidatus Hodarchaeota archaeon]
MLTYFLLIFAINCKNKIEFPQIPLKNINKNEGINLYNGEYILLIFSPSDCSICMDDITTMLNRINNKKNKNIKIIGIINTKFDQALIKIKDNYDINFILLQDTTFATKNFFSKSSLNIQKPILVQLLNGTIIRKGIVGAPKDQNKIKQILEYLQNGN